MSQLSKAVTSGEILGFGKRRSLSASSLSLAFSETHDAQASIFASVEWGHRTKWSPASRHFPDCLPSVGHPLFFIQGTYHMCSFLLGVWAYWWEMCLPQTRSRDHSSLRLRPSPWSSVVPGRGTPWFAEWMNKWRTETYSDDHGGRHDHLNFPNIGYRRKNKNRNKIWAHTDFSLINKDVDFIS